MADPKLSEVRSQMMGIAAVLGTALGLLRVKGVLIDEELAGVFEMAEQQASVAGPDKAAIGAIRAIRHVADQIVGEM